MEEIRWSIGQFVFEQSESSFLEERKHKVSSLEWEVKWFVSFLLQAMCLCSIHLLRREHILFWFEFSLLWSPWFAHRIVSWSFTRTVTEIARGPSVKLVPICASIHAICHRRQCSIAVLDLCSKIAYYEMKLHSKPLSPLQHWPIKSNLHFFVMTAYLFLYTI